MKRGRRISRAKCFGGATVHRAGFQAGTISLVAGSWESAAAPQLPLMAKALG